MPKNPPRRVTVTEKVVVNARRYEALLIFIGGIIAGFLLAKL